MKIKELSKEALDLWGVEAQIDIVIEELAELIQILSKRHRIKDKKELYTKIAEELADVEIVIKQLRLIIGDEIVDEQKVLKLERLEKLIEKTKRNNIECVYNLHKTVDLSRIQKLQNAPSIFGYRKTVKRLDEHSFVCIKCGLYYKSNNEPCLRCKSEIKQIDTEILDKEQHLVSYYYKDKMICEMGY